jgi:hypothetical protein
MSADHRNEDLDDDLDAEVEPVTADGEAGKRPRVRALGTIAPELAAAELVDDDELADDELEDADDDGDEDGDDEDDADADAEGAALADGTGVDLPSVSRKVRRRRRRSRPRSKTIAMKRLTREELRQGALMYPPVDIPRPTSREECRGEHRPCPWVACKHHLYLDVNPETGSIKINFPDLEPWELKDTCALDVAERGGITLEEVGEIMNLTRERIRQVEVRGLLKLKMASPSPDELGADLLKMKALTGNDN